MSPKDFIPRRSELEGLQGSLQSHSPLPHSLCRKRNWSPVSVSFCCITNHSAFTGFKPQMFTLSHVPWVTWVAFLIWVSSAGAGWSRLVSIRMTDYLLAEVSVLNVCLHPTGWPRPLHMVISGFQRAIKKASSNTHFSLLTVVHQPKPGTWSNAKTVWKATTQGIVIEIKRIKMQEPSRGNAGMETQASYPRLRPLPQLHAPYQG